MSALVREIGFVTLALVFSVSAISSVPLLWAGMRWPQFGRSILWNLIAGGLLSLLVVFSIEYATSQVSYSDAHPLLYASFVLAAVAVGLQIAARRSFSRGRAAGIGVTALALPVVALLSNL
jgi:hypothetical protein